MRYIYYNETGQCPVSTGNMLGDEDVPQPRSTGDSRIAIDSIGVAFMRPASIFCRSKALCF